MQKQKTFQKQLKHTKIFLCLINKYLAFKKQDQPKPNTQTQQTRSQLISKTTDITNQNPNSQKQENKAQNMKFVVRENPYLFLEDLKLK